MLFKRGEQPLGPMYEVMKIKQRKTKQRDSRGRIDTIVGSFLSLASKQIESVLLKTVELQAE